MVNRELAILRQLEELSRDHSNVPTGVQHYLLLKDDIGFDFETEARKAFDKYETSTSSQRHRTLVDPLVRDGYDLLISGKVKVAYLPRFRIHEGALESQKSRTPEFSNSSV